MERAHTSSPLLPFTNPFDYLILLFELRDVYIYTYTREKASVFPPLFFFLRLLSPKLFNRKNEGNGVVS